MGETTKKLLEKMPAEKCWALSAQTLTRFSVLRGSKIMPSVLGEEEGVIAPVWGLEKFEEIFEKGGFDAVIGNPPYLFITEIPMADRYYYQKMYSTISYRFDLYGAFIEQALRENLT